MSIELSSRSLRLLRHETPARNRTTRRYLEAEVVWTLRVLAAIALTSSAYLAWIAWTHGAVAGCGTGGTLDCSHVLDSRWSTLFGIPVSVPAIALHSTVLALLFAPQRWRVAKWRRPLIMLASFSAALAALWFLGLQVFWLKHMCLYCVVVHACGIGMAAVAAWWGRSSVRLTAQSLAMATVLLSALVAGQLLATPPEKFEIVDHAPLLPSSEAADIGNQGAADAKDENTPPAQSDAIFQSPLSDQVSASPPAIDWVALWNPVGLLTTQVAAVIQEDRTVSTSETPTKRKTATILNGVELDVTEWPLLGKPDADIVIAEMLDYTCSHCQTTHQTIHAAMQHYGNRLAIVVLPVPLDSSCNPHIAATSAEHAEACQLAKLAITVWHQAPEQFSSFHHWLMDKKPNYSQAIAHAETLIEGDKLRAALASRLPSEFIAKNLELYQRASAGTIPKLLFPTSSVVGEIRSPQAIIELIDRNFAAR